MEWSQLLAFNPPIESARAGEAGKGFAVVAGEVTDLVSETAAATERIRQVVEAQGTIAAAVEEQNASTAQAQEAISGASREAARMAAELQRIVAVG